MSLQVVHVATGAGAAGEPSIADAVHALREIGVGGELCVVRDRRDRPGTGALIDRAEELGVPTHVVRADRRIGVRAIARLRRRVLPAAIIHAHGCRAAALATLASGRRPVFVTHREPRGSDLFRAAHLSAARVAYARAARVIVSTPWSTRRLAGRGVSPERLMTVPDFLPEAGLGARVVPPPETDALRVVHVGRLRHDNGVDVLLKALAWTSDPRLVLDVVGDGPEVGRLEGLAAEHSLDGRVRFLGYREDVLERIADSHIVALPLRPGGAAPGLVEAMVVGRPVVASRVPGIVELFDHGLGGVLVPPDDAAAMAGALDEVAAEVDVRTQLALAGALEARRTFSPRRWAEHVLASYEAELG